jgi:hypothetical protein
MVSMAMHGKKMPGRQEKTPPKAHGDPRFKSGGPVERS